MPTIETERFKKLKSDRTYPMSNTKQSRNVIRDHMLSYFDPSEYDGAKDALDAMSRDAESAADPRFDVTDWAKGKRLAEIGTFDVSTGDMADLLKKIYAPEDVDKWDSDKIFDRYTNLIGREYARMMEARRKGKL